MIQRVTKDPDSASLHPDYSYSLQNRMIEPVFIDTGYVLALVNTDDRYLPDAAGAVVLRSAGVRTLRSGASWSGRSLARQTTRASLLRVR